MYGVRPSFPTVTYNALSDTVVGRQSVIWPVKIPLHSTGYRQLNKKAEKHTNSDIRKMSLNIIAGEYLDPHIITREFSGNCNIPICVRFCNLFNGYTLSLSPLRHGNSRRRSPYVALSVTAIIGPGDLDRSLLTSN